MLTKYDSNGNRLWHKGAIGGSVNGVATDAFNGVYLTGQFGRFYISFGSITLAKTGFRDAFFVKYDSSGNVLWAKDIGAPGNTQNSRMEYYH